MKTNINKIDALRAQDAELAELIRRVFCATTSYQYRSRLHAAVRHFVNIVSARELRADNSSTAMSDYLSAVTVEGKANNPISAAHVFYNRITAWYTKYHVKLSENERDAFNYLLDLAGRLPEILSYL
ncbi:MAG: hypothetical protein D6712_17270 [Chloroflexi bacterium]|nr:MAG: hypothetical protein D6712_17270 [Chloroflexota bacterium]